MQQEISQLLVVVQLLVWVQMGTQVITHHNNKVVVVVQQVVVS